VENGIRAEAVWGAMKRAKNEMIMRRFESGETEVLVNAKLLIEGWTVRKRAA